ncbi:1-acyl-sn-glycerol-3-phosphate acyltransferase [Pimelobacter simplex]|uniref:1-acyl-sn-glycerol-3-phosphate acyltransferase n=1 Tax=Nocardioides simplex TaxID=2045 RepID=A0A0A1DUW5_NOCSI|nr:lysophospholipid acyltransferase family protein [Pimelobacter simplex]AIY19215.1 1-acyl-sn-glycerol-3-phosphate acyltransferase [Pimelobacter simplex]MCG8149279.1 1-acyl-sn-glycerol-3-phosphate acyltransferase [Pimelobacter simplex]GEB16591.1 putative 1-acylglycerol-3-phosphate O-acyltransferase [Pimelobacter simplex]SFM21083.1 1-acyl-sn-glycerol-3-phosphate acyltransferase [Pimelobacter simplex]
MWFWMLKWVLLGPVVRWYTRPRVRGRQHVPASGPVVVAANHAAEIDSLVLSLVLPRQPRFLAKAEYYRPGPRGRLYRWLCAVTGQIPVDRDGGSAASTSLAAAERLLRDGGVWAIYPEGTRSPDGRLYRGHTGVVRVARAVPGAVVLPVGLVGTAAVDPSSRRGWRRGRVRVDIGAPVDVTAGDVRAGTDLLMAAIGSLTGQEPLDHYPERRRAA